VSFAPKVWNRKSFKQAPHSEQATGHGMHCSEILFTPRCSPRAREFPRSDNYDVRLRCYGASKLPNFWILAYFPHTKPLKSTFRWPAYSQGLHRRMITIFSCGRRKSKMVPSGSGVFLQLLVGKLGTPKLAQIGYTHIECYYTAR